MIKHLIKWLFAASTLFLFNCQTNKRFATNETYTYKKHQELQHRFVSTDGELAYIDKGEGEVFLLLHGIPSSSWLYRKMIDSLVNKGF